MITTIVWSTLYEYCLHYFTTVSQQYILNNKGGHTVQQES